MHYSITVYRNLGASSLASVPRWWPATHLSSSYHPAAWSLSPVPTWIVMGMTLIFFFVVLPAVWSRDAARREAALVVLDRLLRFFRR